MCKLVIMRGVSGSGKSTWIEENTDNAVVCSADHFFLDEDGVYNFDPSKLGDAHAACFKAAHKAMSRCCLLVVIDNTNTTRAEMTPYIMLAKMHGFDVELVHISVDGDLAALENAHEVPLRTVQAQAGRFEDRLPFDPPERVVVRKV